MTDCHQHEIKVFSGTSNPAFAQSAADWLKLPLGKLRISRFSDGEAYVKFEESVRGSDRQVLRAAWRVGDHLGRDVDAFFGAVRRLVA